MDTKQNEPLFPFAFAPIYQGSFFLKLSQNVNAYFPFQYLHSPKMMFPSSGSVATTSISLL